MTPSCEFAIYWGSMPDASDTPSHLSFSSSEEVDAYFKGIEEADGFMEVNFVEHSRYYVNKDDEIVERGGQGPAPKSTERYAVWGEQPERGTRAQTYAFETEAEAAAFEQGATDMAGWAKYFCVPSAEFKPCADALGAREFLDKAALEAFETHIENEGGFYDLVFVRADGAYVGADWTVGDPIENEPPAAPTPRRPRP